MKILAIETSCDETALAIVEAKGDNQSPSFHILNTALYSQAKLHEQYGGVFPSLAKREHAKNLIPLLIKLINNTGENLDLSQIHTELKGILKHEPELFEAFIKEIPKIKKPDIDLISVTYGPGLEPALWVGINFARALSLAWQIPVISANHMEGHIVSVLSAGENIDPKSRDIIFPAIALLISGGHTEIVLVKSWGEYEILGKTKDDAVGEAYDKTARLLKLPYPGGPEISHLADLAREKNLETESVKLPRPMIKTADFDFSFSGLKTAVLYLIKNLEKESPLSEELKQKIALEFENAVAEVLFKKTHDAIKKFNAKTLIIGGGVVANKNIRKVFSELEKENIKVLIPEISLSTDNASMIAMAGFLKSFREKAKINPEITAEGNLVF